ncbi:Pr6Pr family membrane protein [Microbacterium sp. HJ5]
MRSMAWARTWSVMRLAMGLVIVAAIAAQLTKSLSTAAELGRDATTTLVNFFSFFTILSNTLAAVILVWAALWYLMRGRRAIAEPPALALALACVTTYMVITGIVYNSLLRHIELPQGSAPIPWSNEVLHLIGPLFLLIDLFVGPLRRALPWRAVWAIVAFPILWVVYTMLRGPLVTNPASGAPFWYPYPFLDPNGNGGWPSVLLYVVAISVAFLVVASLVVWWGRRVGAERDLDHATGDHVEEEWRDAREAEDD